MAKTIKQSKTDDVNDYLDKLVHPLKGVLLELRQHLLTRFSEISEHIKWNSLSFYFNGDMNAFNPKEYKRDLLVVNLNKKNMSCWSFLPATPYYIKVNYLRATTQMEEEWLKFIQLRT